MLVGKGITFDTGGLSIKPAEAMVNMKRDMTGGAVVLAVMGALAAVGCPVRVTGLVAAAENAVGGNALRPGDVVRHYGGRTTEVTNTDAEGRLVLADALAYAVDELGPAVLVDVATLTGAMKVALGQQVGGYFANDDALAAALARGRRGRRRAAVALPAGRRLRGEARLQGRRRRQRAGRTGRDHGGAVPPALRRRRPLGPPRHRLRRRRPGRELRVDHRARPASVPARCCTWLGTPEPLDDGGIAMKGLTVRWSLADAPDGVEDELASYVADTSHAKFTGMAGLASRPGGCAGGVVRGLLRVRYREAREDFQEPLHRGGSRVAGLAARSAARRC